MNAPSLPSAPRRRYLRWLATSLGLCLAPIVLLALVAASYVRLDRDAAVLRRHVMAATRSVWTTKVQLTIGSTTLGAIRSGMGFLPRHGQETAEARLALAAVDHASVGVYERAGETDGWSRQQLFSETDSAMAARGWSRLVGVADGKDTVLVYAPQTLPAHGRVDLCVAVVNARELVVVSTRVETDALAELVATCAPAGPRGTARFARVDF